MGFQQQLEPLEILTIGPSHRGGHEWRDQPRETGRFAAIPQCHSGAGGIHRGPRVGRLHRERAAIPWGLPVIRYRADILRRMLANK